MALTAPAFVDYPPPRTSPWPVPASVVAHGLLLLALTYWTTVRPIVVPPVLSIDVQVLSEREYRAAVSASPTSAASAPSETPPPVTATPPDQRVIVAKAEPAPTSPSAAQSVRDGMTRATKLFSASVLQEPTSRGVRQTLTTLAPYEWVTQLCNLEALEQIRRLPGVARNVDSISASPFAETTLQGGTLTAPGAAYRSERKWYEVQFTCAVQPNLLGVIDFRFKIGPAIPPAEWDSHNLIGQDAAE